jgi:nucleotide-binding universal stress UspA family protein
MMPQLHKGDDMRTILVPLDSSVFAEQILPSAKALATLLSARLHLLSIPVDRDLIYPLDDVVERFEEDWKTGMQSSVASPQATMRASAEVYLAQQQAMLQSSGFEVTTEVRFGDPANHILAVAKQCKADFIAMTTHGYSGLRRWALGSVTDTVLHMAQVPLLLVRNAEGVHALSSTPARMLVPLDGSAVAAQVLPLAVELALAARAELVLLSVIDSQMAGVRSVGWAEQQQELMALYLRRAIQPFAHTLEQHGVTMKLVAEQGDAAVVIVDTAQQLSADLVIMATHGHSGLRRWALGSTADNVLHTATQPLLLVRAYATY